MLEIDEVLQAFGPIDGTRCEIIEYLTEIGQVVDAEAIVNSNELSQRAFDIGNISSP